jgi:hypothetical protein
VQQKPRAGEVLPLWPQPLGIFATGNQFSLIKFLMAIRELYEKVSGSIEGTKLDSSLEDEAFAQLLTHCTRVVDGIILFELYDLIFVENIADSLIVEDEGKRYLRIDCLRTT